MVKSTEDVLKNIGLRTGRVCCGLFALMEHAVIELCVKQRATNAGNSALVAACEGSIAVLVQQDGQWKELRCRSGMGADAVETSLQIITPLVQKLPQGSPVHFISDGQDLKFRSEIMAHLEKISAVDMTQDDLLWRVIGMH